jgi:hypothetical protein
VDCKPVARLCGSLSTHTLATAYRTSKEKEDKTEQQTEHNKEEKIAPTTKQF